jgi:hypothetical protein
VLGWWNEADLAVQASVVEPVDVLRDGELEVVDALPGSLVADQLGLEQRVERLGQRVVIAVTGAADGGDRAGLGEALGVAHGDVLTRLNRSSQHRPIEVIVGAHRGPRLASSNREPSEVGR